MDDQTSKLLWDKQTERIAAMEASAKANEQSNGEVGMVNTVKTTPIRNKMITTSIIYVCLVLIIVIVIVFSKKITLKIPVIILSIITMGVYFTDLKQIDLGRLASKIFQKSSGKQSDVE